MNRAASLFPYFRTPRPARVDWLLPVAEEAREVLRNVDQYMPKLLQLDQRVGHSITEQLRLHGIYLKPKEYRDFLFDPDKKSYRPKKALSSVVEPLEQSEGISVLYALGILPSDVFSDVLANGQVIKDVTLSEEHGEWSHRLQIALLSLARQQGGLLLPDDLRMSDFLKAMSHFNSLDDDGFNGRFKDKGVWDFVFDRNKIGSDNVNSPFNTQSIHDIASPENFTKMVAQSENILPYLAPILELRVKKRKDQGMNHPYKRYEISADYYMRKMFGIPFSQASPEQRRIALQATTGTVFSKPEHL
ncbi:hypothetical protein N0A02_28985 [Paraburkholderia acidicola]|uniref:DUF5636 domain-containing protein n=1 Tax=Paraburkholderia acidicola TaxID=1912599 RepID=A0ABV1LVY4_9BURK